MMINDKTTEGIVLRSLEYKERQRILTVFTEQFGLISLIVKGLSKRKHHLLAIATPFSQSAFVLRRQRSELFNFLDGTLLDEHLSLRGSFAHLQAAGHLGQAILRSQLPEKAAPALYALFASYLKQIPHLTDPTPLILSFQLKLWKHEGLLELSDQCSCCEATPTHLQEGESVCPLHAKPHAQSFSVKEWSTLKELLYVRSFQQLQNIPASPNLIEKIII
jgi:DNA repair protein RecO (recombination protein O)